VPTFRVKAGNKFYDVKTFGNGGHVIVNRVSYRVDFARVSPHLFSLILDGRSFQLYLHLDGEKARAAYGGTEQVLSVEDEYSMLLRSFEKKRSQRRASLEIQAPMPGLVTKVEVDKGTRVEEGAALVVLEAMKMENQIRAPLNGTVGEIYTREGAAVERGETLLSLIT
jgi:biotin carboxyl carrier protein